MKKIFKFTLITVLFLFIVVNALVAIHSYKFTHIVNDIQAKSNEIPKEVPLSTKLKILFTGIDIPRYISDKTPSSNYKDIKIRVDDNRILGGWYIPTDCK